MKKLALVVLLLFAHESYGQMSIPVSVAFPHIAVGGDPSSQNFTTLVQMVNNNSATISGHLALFADDGSPLQAMFDDQGPQAALDISLAAGEARQIQLTLNGSLASGSMLITYSPADALTTVVLQFRSGTAILSEVGVAPTYSLIDATDFAIDTDAILNTGIAVANPTSNAAFVLARLWDPNAGTVLSSVPIALAPNSHLARFATELFPDVPGIGQIRAKLSLDSCSSPSCAFAGGNGFIATAVRLNGDQFTTVPVTERPAAGDPVRILPQVAFGGPSDGFNMKTILYFTTNVASGVFGTADIFDDNGTALAASADGAPPASSIPITVPGNRVTRIVLSGDETLRAGWIRLTLSGSVHLIANAVFQSFEGPTLVSEASVLDSAPVSQGLIYVKTESGLSNIGVALANPEPNPITITVQLFDPSGVLVDKHDVAVPVNGHIAKFVTDIFPQIASAPSFDGAFDLHTSNSFSALALRWSSGKFSTLPVSSSGMYRPSITAVRVTSTQRSPATVNFQIDVTDLSSDLATDSSPTVLADAYIDFGSAFDFASINLNGNPMLNQSSGTLSGSFRPPNITGTVPTGTQAAFYINVYDAVKNISNIMAVLIRF